MSHSDTPHFVSCLLDIPFYTGYPYFASSGFYDRTRSQGSQLEDDNEWNNRRMV
jgi:hypothetical protein